MKATTTVLNVPFHRASLGTAEIDAVAEVIRSGWLTMGSRTFEFERQFATYVGATYAVAVSSCTAALHLALEAVGVKRYDEVLLPTTTFTATAEVVTYLGARPVLVDVDPRTLNISLEDAARKISPRTKAIIPVHFGGQPCDMAEIHTLAEARNLHVIEDAAHALPSEYRGKRVGSLSELTAFSFYATKTLTTGEGGMITTDNEEYAKRLQLMRLHGISRDAWNRYGAQGSWHYEVQEAGYKYNLTDIQAALGIVQLAKCDDMSEARRRVAEIYNQRFAGVEVLETPSILSDRSTSWHLYVLRLNLARLKIGRDRFITELADRGVTTSVHFIPLHTQPFYQNSYGYKLGDFPCAEKEYERSLSLPLFPSMTDDEIEHCAHSVLEVSQEWAS
jgi:dTDP-4-amino-4,6-dideoxygalactose transaminase